MRPVSRSGVMPSVSLRESGFERFAVRIAFDDDRIVAGSEEPAVLAGHSIGRPGDAQPIGEGYTGRHALDGGLLQIQDRAGAWKIIGFASRSWSGWLLEPVIVT